MRTKTMFMISLISALMAAFFAEEPTTRPSRARTRNQLLGYAQQRDTTAEVKVTNRDPDDVISRSRRSVRWRRTLVACPSSAEGSPTIRCPSRYLDICIEDFQLCDGSYDCPGMEDEDPTNCLFYTMMRDKLNFIEWTIAEMRRHARRQ